MQFVGLWGWGCLHCTRNIFQQINASQDLNTQSDREFQALSEYIITFLEGYFYSDEKFKKLVDETKSSLWESGHEDAFIALKLFFNKWLQENK